MRKDTDMYRESTKSIMTKRQCGERLLKEYLVGIPAFILFTVLIAILLLIAIFTSFLIAIIIFGLCAVLTVVVDVDYAIKAIKIKNGKFKIEKAKLMRIDKETVYRGRRYVEITVFYFVGGDRYKISIADGNIKEYSNIDDEFYLICVGKGKKRIKDIYNCRLYEIKQ